MELVPRHHSGWAQELLEVSPVVVIEGARQVGKSTLAQLLSGPDEAILTTLDDEATRLFAQNDPLGFVRLAGEKRLVIDEVQRCPELVLPLKAEVDRGRRPGRFVLTGSANLLRIPDSEDSLAGRAMTIRLHPFSQGELGRTQEDWVAAMLVRPGFGGDAPDRSSIADMVTAGGYPPVQTLAPRIRAAWLTDYVDRLVERDSTDLGTTQVPVLRRLLSLLAAAPGHELVTERLSQALGISSPTVNRYLSILEGLFLIENLPSWSRSLTNRQVRRPKCYLTDTGLACALNGLTSDHLLTPLGANHLGPMVENFVFNELTRQRGWSAAPFALSHYRDRNGAEVDIVIETPQGVIGIEVKAAAAPARSHFKHLVGMRDRLGEKFLAGVVLNFGVAVPAGDRLWSMPVTSLWETPT